MRVDTIARIALGALAISCANVHDPSLDATVVDAIDVDAGSDACVLCSCPAPGRYDSVPFASGGATRFYLLYVPSSWRCDGSGALWVDLHRQSQQVYGGPTYVPDEALMADALIERAEREGLVLLRPRAALHPQTPDDGMLYWEFSWVNPTTGATLPDEVAFLEQLVPDVQTSTHASSALYLTGDSLASGITVPLLASDSPLRFDGVGSLAGRIALPMPPAGNTLRPNAHVWGETRWQSEFGHAAQTEPAALRALLGDASVRILASPIGWPSLDWDYDDAIAWLVHGTAPVDHSPVGPWSRESFPSADADLLGLVVRADGTMLATAQEAQLFGRDASGTWAALPAIVSSPSLPLQAAYDACLASTGDVVVTDGEIIRSGDGVSFVRDPHDESFGLNFLRLACGASGPLVGSSGYEVLVSGDVGRSWDFWPGAADIGVDDIAISPLTGSVLAVGLTYGIDSSGAESFRGAIRRAPSAEVSTSFEPITVPDGTRILRAVDCGADGTWWVVGEDGVVLRSNDDAHTFTRLSGGVTRALFDVAGRADGSVLAVGAYGAAVVSHDGLTLDDVSTGAAGFLGAGRWLAGGGAIVVGEAGLVMRADAL